MERLTIVTKDIGTTGSDGHWQIVSLMVSQG
jgi:hypothetical protein